MRRISEYVSTDSDKAQPVNHNFLQKENTVALKTKVNLSIRKTNKPKVLVIPSGKTQDVCQTS